MYTITSRSRIIQFQGNIDNVQSTFEIELLNAYSYNRIGDTIIGM